ncbi:hypothetical protein V5799_018701 [Amblyomma americanum]|uniref:Uncharacterized protein n=1 Tax=Amblyomma americanum TaxID=6943 RepID=A0AAQ4EZS7_AMBAM
MLAQASAGVRGRAGRARREPRIRRRLEAHLPGVLEHAAVVLPPAGGAAGAPLRPHLGAALLAALAAARVGADARAAHLRRAAPRRAQGLGRPGANPSGPGVPVHRQGGR